MKKLKFLLLLLAITVTPQQAQDDLLPVVGWYTVTAQHSDGGITLDDLQPLTWRNLHAWNRHRGRATLLESGRIVTAWHVTGDTGNVVELLGRTGTGRARVIAHDRYQDLAELAILGSLPEPHKLRLIDWGHDPGDSGGPSRLSSGTFSGVVTHKYRAVSASAVQEFLR